MSSLFQMRILRDRVKQEWFQKGYPIIDWNTEEGIYADADYAFDGDWLAETVSETDYDLKYPLTINPFHLPVGLQWLIYCTICLTFDYSDPGHYRQSLLDSSLFHLRSA